VKLASELVRLALVVELEVLNCDFLVLDHSVELADVLPGFLELVVAKLAELDGFFL
jgi:hypothetical protein